MNRTVLVAGGTGGFGRRLVEGLLASSELGVIVAARNLLRAEEFAASLRALHPQRRIAAAALDVATVTPDNLRRLGAWCVADMVGPFQGMQPRLAETAIAAGCHYVDIADARDFVARIPQLDAKARAAGVLIASGASSTPAISQAVLDRLVADWQCIDRIEIVIAPGNQQPRGLSLVRAILARAGQPARVFHGGAWRMTSGWGMLVRRRLPGLGWRWLSVVETPDIDLVPARFGPRDSALFRASLELPVMHVGLWAISRLVAARLLPSLLPLARPLQWTAERLYRFGSDRGGMTVTAEGRDTAGRAITATWVLVASHGDGPNIPVLPALAVIKALAAGTLTHTGAKPCVGLVPLEAIGREFARFRIVTRTVVRPRALFARALGKSFDALPAAIRAAHQVDGSLRLAGRASVQGGENLLARLLARLFGFPPASADISVRVDMKADRDGETWRRTFGARSFRSRLSPAHRRSYVHERFGLFTFLLALTANADGIDMEIIGGRLGWLPLPKCLLPRSLARERVDQMGRFTFDVPIALPGIGLLIHYRGWLTPEYDGSAG